MTRLAIAAVVALLVFTCGPARAAAQTPQVPPAEGYVFHDEQLHGPFMVQRWVSTTSPDVSPAGMCDCISVVYAGERRVLTLGAPGDLLARSIDPLTGQDVNRDGVPDLVVSTWSGGAHCCYTTTVFSMGTEPRQILSADTGNCAGELRDLDADNVLEFITCDDAWAYAHCSFASSPLPTVVLAHDAAAGQYVPATPRHASRLLEAIAAASADAETTLAAMAASGGADAGEDKCAVLRPVLGLVYSGRIDEGLTLLRRLYTRPDRPEFERQTIERARTSRFFVQP